MKNVVAYKNKKVCLKSNIYPKQTFTFSFRPVLPLDKNYSTDLQSKAMYQFLYNGKTGLNETS